MEGKHKRDFSAPTHRSR